MVAFGIPCMLVQHLGAAACNCMVPLGSIDLDVLAVWGPIWVVYNMVYIVYNTVNG